MICRNVTACCSIAARRLSLHLFEHVHGESRDRGQAMVDLKAMYENAGLFVTRELPDYVPLLLEFLSTQPRPEANCWGRPRISWRHSPSGSQAGMTTRRYAASSRSLPRSPRPELSELLAGPDPIRSTSRRSTRPGRRSVRFGPGTP